MREVFSGSWILLGLVLGFTKDDGSDGSVVVTVVFRSSFNSLNGFIFCPPSPLIF